MPRTVIFGLTMKGQHMKRHGARLLLGSLALAAAGAASPLAAGAAAAGTHMTAYGPKPCATCKPAPGHGTTRQVSTPTVKSSSLVFTGTDAVALVSVAAASVGAGGMLVLVSRRRRGESTA